MDEIENMDEIKEVDIIFKVSFFFGIYLFQMFVILDMTPHNKIFIFFSGFFIILMRGGKSLSRLKGVAISTGNVTL